jgi:hypothetical protein
VKAAAAVVVALLAAGVVACDQHGPESGEAVKLTGSSSSGAEGSQVASSASVPPTASWSTPLGLAPPLAEYATYLAGPSADAGQTARLKEAWDSQQGEMASCMRKQGFDYTPREFQPPIDLGAADQTITNLPVPLLAGERADVVAYGYGLMADPETRLADDSPEDPNVAHADSLGPAAALEFNAALYGDPYSQDPGDLGCSGEALTKFPQPAGTSAQEAFDSQFGDLAAAASISTTRGLMEDRRTLELDTAWEVCMSRAGFELDSDADHHGPVLGLDLAIRTRQDGSAGPRQPDTPTADISMEEKSLLGTEAERGVAVADFDCRVTTDYITRISAIRVARDNEFIDANREALEQLVVAASSW